MSDVGVQVLVDTIRTDAESRKWAYTVDPKPLRHRDYRSGTIETIQKHAEPTDTLKTIGIFVDVYAVLIASLGEDVDSPDTVGQQLIHCLEKAAKVRTWLDSAKKENFYLFLVGPLGSAEIKEWRDNQYRFERDERICRKLVWLPPGDDSLLKRESVRFCNRTFMARPWLEASRNAEELDPLRVVLAAAQLPATWYEVLESRTISDKDIAELLIRGLPDDVTSERK
ncbi:ABC-three component system middle component 1 [Sorangium sp. So ce117]|uniref:ABC-three component system middle component 1 n=1 Tax=Sorangium sp. So ce117 TaxID=3133277 RepID=UPI003F5ED9DD